MAKSIIQKEKECFICKTTRKLEEHHCIFGKNRKLADEDGLVVWLCNEHHRGTNGVHGKNGYFLGQYLKQVAQRSWMNSFEKNISDFVKRYGRNYL